MIVLCVSYHLVKDSKHTCVDKLLESEYSNTDSKNKVDTWSSLFAINILLYGQDTWSSLFAVNILLYGRANCA